MQPLREKHSSQVLTPPPVRGLTARPLAQLLRNSAPRDRLSETELGFAESVALWPLYQTFGQTSVPAYILWIASEPYLVRKQKSAARHPAHPAKSPRRPDSPAKKENRLEKFVDFSVFSECLGDVGLTLSATPFGCCNVSVPRSVRGIFTQVRLSKEDWPASSRVWPSNQVSHSLNA